jgi:hypothetical protein
MMFWRNAALLAIRFTLITDSGTPPHPVMAPGIDFENDQGAASEAYGGTLIYGARGKGPNLPALRRPAGV